MHNKMFRKYTLIITAILIFALTIRITYLNINPAVWWDEAEYLSTAKHWALNTPYEISPQRQPLFPLLIAVFYKLGINDLKIIRFFTVLIPSILSVYVTYLLGKELYNKIVGLIGALLLAVFWEIIFWTSRFSTDILGYLFGTLAFYYFWKGYIKKEAQSKNLILMGVSIALGFLTRVGNIIPIFTIIVYMIITERHKFIFNKSLWIAAIISVIVILPYLIWNQINFENSLAFWEGYLGRGEISSNASIPIPWNIFNIFKIFSEPALFIVFLIGLVTFLSLLISLDILLKNNKEAKLKSDLFLIILVLVTMPYFMFIVKRYETRWLFIILSITFFIIARGFNLIYFQLKKYNKIIAFLVICILLIFGTFQHLNHANSIINIKKDTYIQLKLAGLWMKENSNENDIILNNGVPQNYFYSERVTLGYPGKEEEFPGFIKEKRPKYMVLSKLELSPDWAYSWPEKNQDKVKPVQVYFADQEQKIPILIVYQFIY